MNHSTWICCQIGAREHYAIPRALHQAGQLSALITDAWVTPQSWINHVPINSLQSLRERYHPDLVNAPVKAFNFDLLRFELVHRLQKNRTWDCIIARNDWFQQRAIAQFQQMRSQFEGNNERPVLFTYSYAALELLKYAKSQGWFTILGQIDPGLVEEQIVIAEHQKHPELAPAWQPVPPQYWETWKAECEIADQILVNSNWSKQALLQVGIRDDKIKIVPLSYTPTAAAQNFQRTYPVRFSTQRPLRVLFLGQIILRKGIAAILEAVKLLQNEPIEFWMVGPIGIDRAQTTLPNIRWIGPVSRSQVAQYYQQADVFLFPSLSDGFGLTQLEAQAWKLPLIVSRFCGEVVKDQVNGIVLSEVSGEAIARVLKSCVNSSSALKHLSQNSTALTHYSLDNLHQQLQHSLYSRESKHPASI